jgi:hypothetical protein
MRKNDIQMQPGLSLSQFIDKYGTEQKCEDVLEKSRWPEDFRCSGCDSVHYYRYRRDGLLIFQCISCSKKVSLTQGTIFHSTKLPLVNPWMKFGDFRCPPSSTISVLTL